MQATFIMAGNVHGAKQLTKYSAAIFVTTDSIHLAVFAICRSLQQVAFGMPQLDRLQVRRRAIYR